MDKKTPLSSPYQSSLLTHPNKNACSHWLDGFVSGIRNIPQVTLMNE
jgi:hypothetical protein